MSEMLSNLYNSIGKSNIQDYIKKNKAKDKKVIYATKSAIQAAQGYIYYSEDTTPFELQTENEEIFYAFNVADNPQISLNNLLASFHTVLDRKDDVIVFDKEDIKKITSLQQGKDGELDAIHITELGIFLTPEDVATVQMDLLEEKEKELEAQAAKIAELEKLLAASKAPKKEKKETVATENEKPTE